MPRAISLRKKGGKNMKKGLLLTLVLSIALLASSAFSYAPVLKPMPDIVIGDADDAGWTPDINLFRFSNAFAFDDYIANPYNPADDSGTTPSLLKWCFIESVTEKNALEINGKPAVDPDLAEDPHNPDSAKELRAGNPTATFRDIHASPHSYDTAVLVDHSGVYPGAPLCDQFITFWTAEPVQQKADSTTIYVKSIDGAVDKLSGGFQFVRSWDFSSGQGWGAATFTGYSLPTAYGPTGGKIGLQGPGASPTGVFGYWQTSDTAIAYEAGKIYRARYVISRNTGLAAAAVPQIRLRWIAHNFTGSSSLSIGSYGSNSNVPPELPASKEYKSYHSPITDSGGFGVTFDMLDFADDESGLVLLDSVTVETMDKAALGTGTSVKEYDSNFSGWEFNVNFGGGFGDISTAGSDANHIALTSTVANGANAGFAQTPANDAGLLYTANQLYRATFNVSRSGASATAFPGVRMRGFSEDSQATAEYTVVHGDTPGPGAPAQSPSATDFEVYWETPTLPASPGTGEDGLRAAFDMLDFSTTEGDTANLNKLTIERFAIPGP
jgi:hypothetical protein